MFNKILYGLIGVGVIAIIGMGVFLYVEFNKEPEASDLEGLTYSQIQDLNDNEETEEQEQEVEELSEEKTGSNPFGDDISQEELSDKDFQAYIHGMSHQKVEAAQKWSFYENTPERVEWLYEALEVAEVEHHKEYKHILSKWIQGDFSTADEDHNTVWRMQGGNVGKATGVLTPEQEREYVEGSK